MEACSESLGDEGTVAPEFSDDADKEDLEEEEAKSARSQIIKYKDVLIIFVLIFCVLGKFLK